MGHSDAGRAALSRMAKTRFTEHGLSYTPEYRAWQTMRLRCTDPEHDAYADYGGRGIGVCARWRGSVTAFVDDMGPKPTPKHELDREDNDAGYDCGKCEDCHARGVTVTNCRWVTRSVNDRNRRNARLLTYRGETLSVVEWAERTGIPSETIRRRIGKHGFTDEEALTIPVRRGGKGSRRSTC